MVKLVSIVIPTFNRAHLLGQTLDSILSQSYQHWECLVIDDGSTDHTTELMEFYQEIDRRICYYKRPKNKRKGPNSCRNYGFEISKGDYINWFDDDDIMHPEKLQTQVTALASSKMNFSVCQSLFFSVVIKSNSGYPLNSISAIDNFYDYLQMKTKWFTPSALWSRDFLKDQDYLFDEELQAAQEWEFHCRMLNRSPIYHITEEPLVFIRKHDASITYDKKENFRNWHYFLARLKIYKNPEITLDEPSNLFLKNYLINSLKRMIVTENPNSVKAYFSFLHGEREISGWTRINALIAIFTYRYLKRGNMFLQKIKYLK